MNAASQFLRVLAILGAIGAGALYWMTHGKIDDLTKQLASANAKVTAATSSGSAAQADLQKQLDAALAAKDTAEKATAAAENKVTLAETRFAAVKQQIDDDATAAKDKDSKIDALNAQITDLTNKVKTTDDIAAKLAAANAQVQNLQDQLSQANDQLKKFLPQGTPGANGTTVANSGDVPTAAPLQLGPAAPAKIVDIDTKNWLMSLDVGDGSVAKDAQLYIKIGDQPLGVVVVRDTQANIAICAIASTDTMSQKDYAKIVTKGLKVDYQRAM